MKSAATVEQTLDLLDLHAHARMQPRLRHQVLVFARQVDRVDELALAVEQAAGFGEEYDFVRLQRPHELVRGEIRVDVEDLPVCRFAEARDHRNRTGLQARLDRRQMYARDLADQAVL